MFVSPGEVCCTFLIFPVYYYGIIIGCSVLTGFLTSFLIQKKYYPEFNTEMLFDLTPYLMIFGLIGARLYYCILNFPYYLNHLTEIFFVRKGGLSIHGCIIAGVLTLIVYAKFKKLSVLKLLDLCSYGLIIGQALGRWGNFFNSEAFGTPTNLPWKLYIPLIKRPLEYLQYEYFHPTFLYESILNVLIFLFLILIVKKSAKNLNGIVFGFYLILYSTARIIIESIRTDSVLNIGQIPIAQIVSAIIIIISIIYLIIIYKKQKKINL